MPQINFNEQAWADRGRTILAGGEGEGAGEGSSGPVSPDREIAESDAQRFGGDTGEAPSAGSGPSADPSPPAAPKVESAPRRGRGRPRKGRTPTPPGSVVTVRLELPKPLYGAVSLHALNRGCSPAAIILGLVKKHIKPVTLPDDDVV